jgi:hypothetical protein
MSFFIEKPKENPDTCFICGRKAITLEHVIPKWLQRRFNLWNQLLSLPNGDSIPYRKVLVPACKRCNNEVYGSLERRMSENVASDSDIWKWANKIHYSLAYRDRIMQWDLKNPGYKIGDVIKSNDPIERDRHFLHCVSGDFKTEPYPFGSVFRFNFSPRQDFAFAHIIYSSSICISVGDVGYVVFVIDGQALKNDIATNEAYEKLPRDTKKEDMLFFYAQCIEHLVRHKLGQNIIMSQNFIARIGKTVVHDSEPVNKERFRAICKKLGLEWIDAEANVS